MHKPCEWCKSARVVRVDEWGTIIWPEDDVEQDEVLAVTQKETYGVIIGGEISDFLILNGMNYCPICGRELKFDG